MRILAVLLLLASYHLVFAQKGPGGVGSTNGTSSLLMWVDADQIEDIADQNNLEHWFDLSGRSHHVSNAVSSQKPNYQKNIVNAFPVVDFDGNNERLQGSLSSFSAPATIVAVAYFDSLTQPNNQNGYIISIGSQGTADKMVGIARRNGNDGVNSNKYYSFNGSTQYFGPTITGQQWTIFMVTINTTAPFHALRIDGATQTVTDFPASIATDGVFRIGDFANSANSLSLFGGKMGEVALYDRVLNDAERNVLMSYLSGKYNISVTDDQYIGDNVGNGNHDRNIIGIGKEAGGSHAESESAGLKIKENSGLDNGDYLMAGHATATNGLNTADASDAGGTLDERWERVWWLDITDASTAMTVDLTFDFLNSGLGGDATGTASNYKLLYRSTNSGNWTILASANSIAHDQVNFTNVSGITDGYYTLGTIDNTNSILGRTGLNTGANGPGGIGNQEATSNLKVWLDAREIDGATGDPVLNMFDRSGNGNDATQFKTYFDIPELKSNAVNGVNAVKFDGVGDFLEGSIAGGSFGSPATIIGAGSFDLTNQGADDNDYLFSLGTTGSANQHASISRRKSNTPADADKFYSWDGNTTRFGPLVNGQQWYLFTQLHASSSPFHSLYIDGSVQSVTDYSSTLSTNANYSVGRWEAGGNFMDGDIGEVIVYNRVLNSAELNIIHSYLGAKYDRTVNGDQYTGDDNGNGDYDFDVAGVGTEAGGSNTDAASAGLYMIQDGNFANGEYLMFGHKTDSNYTKLTDVAVNTASTVQGRWERVWYVDMTDAPPVMQVDVKFDFSEAGTGGFPGSILSDYKLLYRTGESGTWTVLATASSVAGDQITFNNIQFTGDGYITLGSRALFNSPLAIKLMDFKAEWVDRNTLSLLRWKTNSTFNVTNFVIERSTDGKDFIEMGIVSALAGNEGNKDYRYLDNSPSAKVNYYRLKAIDENGNEEYSNIISLYGTAVSEAQNVKIWPNPTTDELNVKLPTDQVGYQIGITDALGMQREAYFATNGLVKLDLTHLEYGVYFLSIKGANVRITKKLIKQ